MKYLIASNINIYNAAGKLLGPKIIEVDGFTEEELKPYICSECGGTNTNHREYFIPNRSQSGFGEVEGQYVRCSKMNRS